MNGGKIALEEQAVERQGECGGHSANSDAIRFCEVTGRVICPEVGLCS